MTESRHDQSYRTVQGLEVLASELNKPVPHLIRQQLGGRTKPKVTQS